MAKRKKRPSKPIKSKKLDPSKIHKIRGFIIIALSLILFFSLYFGIAGIIGKSISLFLRGTFGIIAYIIPIYLLAFGIYDFLEKNFFKKRKHIIITILLFFSISLFIASVNLNGELSLSTEIIKETYFSGENINSYGIFGAFFALLLFSLIGKVITIILSILLILFTIFLGMNFKLPSFFVKDADSDRGAKSRGELDRGEKVSRRAKSDKDIEENENYDPPEPPYDNRTRIKVGNVIDISIPKKDNRAELTDFFKGQDFDETKFSAQDFELPNKRETKKIRENKSFDAPFSFLDDGFDDEPYENYDTERLSNVDFSGNTAENKGMFDDGFDDEEPEAEMSEVEVSEATPPSVPNSVPSPVTPSVPNSVPSPNSEPDSYIMPSITLLKKPIHKNFSLTDSKKESLAETLERIFRNFKVEVKVTNIIVGPTVTKYEVTPMLGVKIGNIKSLEQDIALNLGVKSVRVASNPGFGTVSIEVYNDKISSVLLSDILTSEEFRSSNSKTVFGLGKNISGEKIIADLKSMPHLLIAGTTGSGKSVCINTILLSLLFKANPDELKLILIDPKVVELSAYNDIPHLLLPVVTDPEKASMALSYAVSIMEKRYRLFEELRVRGIDDYNEKVKRLGEEDGREILPKIIVVIDELADLMMVSSSKVQESISRIAQKARAAGIHLIVATQQPLSSILTSIIKANIPSRIAFAVSSATASRVILDKQGAERLLGKGDMLFNPIGVREPMRIQGAFVSDDEIKRVTDFIKSQVKSEFTEEEVKETLTNSLEKSGADLSEEDDLLKPAIDICIEKKKASTSLLQRYFRIGYNRAADLMDKMEEMGVVSKPDGARPREILVEENPL